MKVHRLQSALASGLAGVVLVALLPGCGLLPGGGEKATDWAGLAEQIVSEAGGDEVSAVQMRSSGQLAMTIRANGAEVGWIATPNGVVRSDDETNRIASRPVRVGDIDWAALEAALPTDCGSESGVMVNWLPFGQAYQRTFCQGEPRTNPMIDGVPVPVAAKGHDEATVQSVIDVLGPLLGDEVLEFTIPLDQDVVAYTMTGPKIVLADGSQAWLSATYFDGESAEPLAVTVSKVDSFVSTPGSTGAVPELVFRPGDLPAAAYTAAIADALTRVPFAADQADGFGVSALSVDELHYVVWSLGSPNPATGTIAR